MANDSALTRFLVLVVALALTPVTFSSASARAPESNAAPAGDEASPGASRDGEGWEFSLGTYLWTTGLRGTAAIAGQEIDVDASFIDIVKATNSLIAIDVLFIARKGRWGFLVDPLYMKIGTSGQGPLGRSSFDLTARIVIAEATGFYTFLQKAQGAGKTTIFIDALVGLRVWWIGMKADGSNGVFSRKDSQPWVDPLAGLAFRFDLARGHVPIFVRGDFGGWGVGSTIAWAATAGVGYRWLLPKLDIGLDLAYRALGPDYADGGFGWDVVMHGPALGLLFSF